MLYVILDEVWLNKRGLLALVEVCAILLVAVLLEYSNPLHFLYLPHEYWASYAGRLETD